MANHRDLRALRKFKNVCFDPVVVRLIPEYQKSEYYLDGQAVSEDGNFTCSYELTRENGKDFQCMLMFLCRDQWEIDEKYMGKSKPGKKEEPMKDSLLSFKGRGCGDELNVPELNIPKNKMVEFYENRYMINICSLEEIENFIKKLRAVSLTYGMLHNVEGLLKNPDKLIEYYYIGDDRERAFSENFSITDETFDMTSRFCPFTYAKELERTAIVPEETPIDELSEHYEGICKLLLVSQDKDYPQYYFTFKIDVEENPEIIAGTVLSVNCGDYVYRCFEGRVMGIYNIINFSSLLKQVTDNILLVLDNIKAGIAKPIEYEEEP